MSHHVTEMVEEMGVTMTEELANRLARVNLLCQRARGQLVSRQVVAMIIEQYERDAE